MTLTRRQFLLATTAVGAAVAVPELWVPRRTIFLPPHGGWGATPLVDLLRQHAELVRPVGVLVSFYETDCDNFDGAEPLLVVNQFNHLGEVSIGISRRLPGYIERSIRRGIKDGRAPRYPMTVSSLLPGYFEAINGGRSA